MATNFTITRLVEASDAIGCTEFETDQHTGDVANSVDPSTGSVILDGSIIWYIDADFGYTVNVVDFDIPNTIPGPLTAPPTAKTFIDDGTGLGISPPITGVVMEEVSNTSSTKIKMTIYLAPNATWGFVGSVFTMPPNNVSLTIPITGCATPKEHESNLRIVDNTSEDVDVSLTVSSDFKDYIVKNEAIANEISIKGRIPEDIKTNQIAAYTVATKYGQRFKVEPQLQLSTSDYIIKSSTTAKDDDGNIISKTFNIFKTT